MPYGERLTTDLESVATAIVDSAYQGHVALGPGLLESVYVACLAHELTLRGFRVRREVQVPIAYKGLQLDTGFRIDLLVEDAIVVEAKSVLDIHPVFKSQLLTHLRLADKRLGFLINFNTKFIKDGITRVAN